MISPSSCIICKNRYHSYCDISELRLIQPLMSDFMKRYIISLNWSSKYLYSILTIFSIYKDWNFWSFYQIFFANLWLRYFIELKKKNQKLLNITICRSFDFSSWGSVYWYCLWISVKIFIWVKMAILIKNFKKSIDILFKILYRYRLSIRSRIFFYRAVQESNFIFEKTWKI